jgi:hypothetical protein
MHNEGSPRMPGPTDPKVSATRAVRERQPALVAQDTEHSERGDDNCDDDQRSRRKAIKYLQPKDDSQ